VERGIAEKQFGRSIEETGSDHPFWSKKAFGIGRALDTKSGKGRNEGDLETQGGKKTALHGKHLGQKW